MITDPERIRKDDRPPEVCTVFAFISINEENICEVENSAEKVKSVVLSANGIAKIMVDT